MRLLVVEDEENLAASLARGLEADGFAVDVAHDGVDGLWRAQEVAYDAIVLDLMLPGMNGFQVCRRLRQAEVWTPILILTAKDGELDETEALDTGADDYLTKPFSHLVLVARLRALLRRGAPARPAVLEVGDLRLDPASRRVWRGDVEIELSAREMALLEALMRRAEQTLSREQLLTHAWGDTHETSSNVVDVYVRYLREKIDRPFGAESLRTVRGLGYRLTGSTGE